jgi:TPP-dependent pyruvate/acetoin dehydrogenase alpha subunit
MIAADPGLPSRMYCQMLLIRCFERAMEHLFQNGKLHGTTHACIGQEAIAVGVINALSATDIVVSNHRGHGHYLARTDDVEGLIYELMGKEQGLCGGRGGSQHLYRHNFYSNGITAGMVPVATGMALAEKIQKTSSTVVCFLGDGAMAEGVVPEAMNMAALWQLPIIYVVENNQYAMSTPVSLGLQGDLLRRATALNIASHALATHEVLDIYLFFKELIAKVRADALPRLILFDTFRLCGHSKSDDRCYQTEAEIMSRQEKDPLLLYENKHQPPEKEQWQKEIEKRIEIAIQKAEHFAQATL